MAFNITASGVIASISAARTAFMMDGEKPDCIIYHN